MVHFVVYVHVLITSHVTQQTNNLEHLFHGVYHTLVTDIITGRGFTVVLSGTDSLVLQLLTQNQWENRYGTHGVLKSCPDDCISVLKGCPEHCISVLNVLLLHRVVYYIPNNIV